MKSFAKYQTFLDLHHQSDPFVLPNAWDAASAKAFQNCGFKAVGTTSAGIAMSLGYPDGEHLPFETLLSVLKTITDAVDIPVVQILKRVTAKHRKQSLKTQKSRSCRGCRY